MNDDALIIFISKEGLLHFVIEYRVIIKDLYLDGVNEICVKLILNKMVIYITSLT